MIPTALAIGDNYTLFMSDHYKFNKNNKIEEGTLFNSTNNNLDLFDYHLAKSGESAIKTVECNEIHSFSPLKKLKQMMRKKIYEKLRENQMIGSKNK